MDASSAVNSNDAIDEESLNRPSSSRLSLGSSPSELSEADEGDFALQDGDDDFELDDGDGSLTPTERILSDEENITGRNEFNMDELFFVDSSDTLSNEPRDIDERETEDGPPFFGSSLSPGIESLSLSQDPESVPEQDENQGTSDHEETAQKQSDKELEEKPASPEEQAPSEDPKEVVSGKKRRGSVSLEQEERQHRRSSRPLQKKAATPSVEAADDGPGSDEKEEAEMEEKASSPGEQMAVDESVEQPKTNSEEENINQEYQQWHKEALEALTKIEVEFARLRDKMYQEKMADLSEEARQIANGTHPELVAMMQKIDEKRNKRIQMAEAWRDFKRANYQQQFEGVKYQANVNYVAGKSKLRRDLLAMLYGKRWDLENERAKLAEEPCESHRLPDGHALLRQREMQMEECKEAYDISQSIGFPRAPGTDGLSSSAIDEDLMTLGLIERPEDSASKTTVANGGRELKINRVQDTSAGNGACSSSGHVYTFQGQLHYHGQVFRKGDQFTIVDVNAGRYNAKLLTATDTEVHVQRTDGSKTKLPFTQLSMGKYQIYAKNT